MKDGAVLSEDRARRVIQAAGYAVVSFARGTAPKRTAFLFRVRALDPERRASLEAELRADLEAADRVAADSLGRVTVVVSGDADAAENELHASLKRQGVAVEALERRIWPKLDATYVVTVPAMDQAAETRTVANVLAGVAKVVAVHVDQDEALATLWLKEPCDALEANVRAALAQAGMTVARFELKSE